MKVRIEPYKLASAGSKRLAKHSGVLRTTKRQLEKHAQFDIVINWGNPRRRWQGCKYLNAPEAVAAAGDKLATFRKFAEAGVPTAQFTTERETAAQWLRDGVPVLVRKLLRGSGGRGIELLTQSEDSVPNAPLYVQYLKKKDEYRIHVFAGKVIDAQQKRRRLEVPDEQVNWQIRNHDNGWVFAREECNPPDAVRDAAIRAVSSLGLDFGAVDVGWNEKDKAACVYEVNTAPGLEGTTLDSYFSAICEAIPSVRGGRHALRRRKVA